jgi:hypothetical protein
MEEEDGRGEAVNVHPTQKFTAPEDGQIPKNLTACRTVLLQPSDTLSV